MATPTRVIVTSQPDVACDVCGRRLLRGEQPDAFLADGRRRVVCELCAPRASAEGWVRESANPEVNLPPARPRRGRNLLGRLRQARPQPAAAALGETARAFPPASLSEVEPDARPTSDAQLASDAQSAPDAQLAPDIQPAPDVREAARPAPAIAFSDLDPAPAGRGDMSDAMSAPAGHGGTPDVPRAPSEEQPEQEQPEEQGSWRDAWMFVKE